MTKIRGFEPVIESKRQNYDIFTDEKGRRVSFPIEPKMPTRADARSSGYDFYMPKDIKLLPMQATIIWTDVKAYMQDDEEMLMFIRSSLAIKSGIMLRNCVGKIDASYYSNEGNDGNIGISLINTTGTTVEIKAGERFAQGSFYKFLTADKDEVLSEKRVGGIGSSGR